MSEVLSDRALLALLWEANNNEVLANYPASPLRPVLRSHRALRKQRDTLWEAAEPVLEFLDGCGLQAEEGQMREALRAALAQCDTQEGV